MKYILILAFITLMTSCSLYRMPTDEDFSSVPLTNNPNIYRDEPGPLPGMQI